jgi:phosphoribosylamine-glycine ligase
MDDLAVNEKMLADAGAPIDAIKAYRNRVGCGLKEAKDKVQEYLDAPKGRDGKVVVALNGRIESLTGYADDDERAEASVYSQTQAFRVVMLRRDANRIRLGAAVRVTVEIDAEGK